MSRRCSSKPNDGGEAIAASLQGLDANLQQVLNSSSLGAQNLADNVVGDVGIGLFAVGAGSLIALVTAILLASHLRAALQYFLTTGQVLTFSAFITPLIQMAFRNAFPSG